MVNIAKKDLHALYIQKGLSSRKIAELYGCAYSTVDRKIRRFGFPVKTLSAAHITTFRAPFAGNLKDKAYLVGFSIGDLRVRKMYKNSETILIDCGSTKPEQIRLIESLFTPYGKIWKSKQNQSGKVQIECAVDESFSFLLRRYDEFPSWATKSLDFFLPLLAGFIDAEGSFFLFKVAKGYSAAFSLGNYNNKMLKQIIKNLNKMKINSKLVMGYKKGYIDKQGYIRSGTYWNLRINRKADLYAFVKLILPHLRHLKRIKDAKRVLSNINLRNRRYGNIGMKENNYNFHYA